MIFITEGSKFVKIEENIVKINRAVFNEIIGNVVHFRLVNVK